MDFLFYNSFVLARLFNGTKIDVNDTLWDGDALVVNATVCMGRSANKGILRKS